MTHRNSPLAIRARARTLSPATAALAVALAVAAPSGAWAAQKEDGSGASLGRSAMRGLTYKAGTFLSNVVAYGAASGDLFQGVALSAALTAYTYASYVYSDYFWDQVYPKTQGTQTTQEILAESAERSTAKWVTYKMVNLPAVLTVGYVATGSMAASVGMWSGLSVLKAGWFYANNMIWDYYETPAADAEADLLPLAEARN